MIISHLKPNGILQPEIVSEQMINGLICNNFAFYRTLIGVHIWWAKLFKAVLILLIAIRLFELLAPAGFGIMCLFLLFYFLIYSFYFILSHCLFLFSLMLSLNFFYDFSFVFFSCFFTQYTSFFSYSYFPSLFAFQSFVSVFLLISEVAKTISVYDQVNWARHWA